MANTGLGILFTKLGKFDAGDSVALKSWLKKFDRCCGVANKVEQNVKGQLLMLFVEGRAQAILEAYEEQEGLAQTYDALVAVLEAQFSTVASRELNMATFERREQNINESEEEFMLDLLKLYRAANPDSPAAATNAAVKRKFLQGVAPELRRGIFVFCT